MKQIKLFGKTIITWGEVKTAHVTPYNKVDKSSLPAKRVSVPSQETGVNTYSITNPNIKIIIPDHFLEVIPFIRKFVYANPDVSQALNNVVELGNTGHMVKFDASVSEGEINKMRAHLDAAKKKWSESNAGMDGLVNKMIAQIMISGALSNEWVPNVSLTGINSVVLVNPETIRWGYDSVKQSYLPMQQVTNLGLANVQDGLITLNTNTYKYYALNGDTDSPYGIPPYLPALDSLCNQRIMMDNIKFIIEQVGVMGFLQVILEKPEQTPSESTPQYTLRLEAFLTEARKRIQEGYRDGITVGYRGDTEFEFQATARNFEGVDKMYQLNELMIASGLKQDASMLGRGYSTSETQITVIFTKLLSQLKNIQALVKCNLEFGYSLELRLAGYNFNSLTVEFNASTALDKLKEAQAEEIKIRNNNALYLDGIISQEQYAHNMGYEKPNQPKPRFLRGSVQTEAEAKAKREKGKDASDKAVRSKNKPQG